MPYIVGASFANVQHSFEAPMILRALAISSQQADKLQTVKTKEEINTADFKKNLLDLSVIEKELRKFKRITLQSDLILCPKKDRKKFGSPESFIYEAYLNALESLRIANPLLLSEGFEKCFLHVPMDQTPKELPVGLSFFNHSLSKHNVTFQKPPECEPILQLARLSVWFENLNVIRKNDNFVNKQIVDNISFRFVQVHKLVWNSPPLESYSDSFVGYPRLILKSRTTTEDLIIRTGDIIDLFLVMRACTGVDSEYFVSRCKQSSARKPFGAFLNNSKFEKCPECNSAIKGPGCLFQRAKCDGKKLQCKNRKFANDVCHSDFCVYITFYMNKLKVGRSMASRVIGRLIEQGAFDALIFYPIPELPFADYLEVQLTKLLQENLNILGVSSIRKVGERVTSKERFLHISSTYNNNKARLNREKMYDKILEVLCSLPNKEAVYLSSVERKKVMFNKSWILPNNNEFCKHLSTNLKFHSIKGRVNGVAGPIVIVGDKTYDFSKIEGYVVGIPKC